MASMPGPRPGARCERPLLGKWALAKGNAKHHRLAAAQKGEIDVSADAVGAEPAHHFAHPPDRRAVPRRHHVADQQSRTGGRPLGVDTDDENAARAAVTVEPDRLQPGAEIAPRHMAFGDELVDGAVDGPGWNGERAPARPEHGHAEDGTRRVDQGAAFRARAQRQVEAEILVDRAAAL